MLSRYFLSFNFAAIITFAIFFSMQMLISQGDITLKEKPKRVIMDFGKIREIPPVDTRELPPVKQKIEEMPEVVPYDFKTTGEPHQSGDPLITDIRPIAPKPGSPGNAITTDGGFIAILRPAPQYPQDMADKGIEGYVRLKYTVTANGSTADIVVMSSSHRGFERSAVKAAQKFKFKPHIEDSIAIAVPNVYSIMEFKLEN